MNPAGLSWKTCPLRRRSPEIVAWSEKAGMRRDRGKIQYRELAESMQAGWYGCERHRERKSCCGKWRKKPNIEVSTTEKLCAGPRAFPPASSEAEIQKNVENTGVGTGTPSKGARGGSIQPGESVHTGAGGKDCR